MDLGIEGLRVLVTAGASGIGLEIACAFAAEGAGGWTQAVVATLAWTDRSTASTALAGVFHPSVLRGLLLRAAASAARSST